MFDFEQKMPNININGKENAFQRIFALYIFQSSVVESILLWISY